MKSMIDNLAIHPKTAADIKQFMSSPAQFLILVGPEGSGKLTLAKMIGANKLGLETVDKHLYFIHVRLPDSKNEISIGQIREVTRRLKLKTAGKEGIRRLVLIEDAQYLSDEAQNALLKTLEEPPADTLIIMTTDSLSNIFPTISSRGRILDVQPIGLEPSPKYFPDHNPADVESAWHLSEGRVGLMRALLSDNEEHELKTAVNDAKKFLADSKYHRLIDSNRFTKNRRQTELLIDGLLRVIKVAQAQSILSDKHIDQMKLLAARRLLDELRLALRANVSPRIIYLKLSLNLNL